MLSLTTFRLWTLNTIKIIKNLYRIKYSFTEILLYLMFNVAKVSIEAPVLMLCIFSLNLVSIILEKKLEM